MTEVTHMNLLQAVNNGLDTAMAADEKVICLGEDIGKFGGVFRATSTLQEKYGLRIPVVALPNGHEKGWPFTAAQIMRLLS